MQLLATYQSPLTLGDSPAIVLTDIETGAHVHTEDLVITALMARARDWASQNGHEIVEYAPTPVPAGEVQPEPQIGY